MIIEMRTYTVQPGSVATVEERFGQALPARAKLSPLAAFWHTEVGPLNRVIHVWAYDSFEERTRVRAESQKLESWPPNIREFVTEQQSEIFLPAPFSPKLEPRQLGNLYEIRTYTLKPGGIPGIIDTLEYPNRRAHQTVAAGRRLVLRARRAQPLVPHLGLQGCCRAFRGPRTCPQRRRLAAAWRAAWRYPEAGEHAGRPGVLLAAALALEPGLVSRYVKRRPAPLGRARQARCFDTRSRFALTGSPTWVVTARSSS